MEEIKKQILLINLANYNETVNNMSKFKLNDREINLFCDIMQQFAEKYHTEQLRIHDVVGRREQLKVLLSKVVDEFDSGEVTWDTRDEIENVLKSL